jgi:hypothetical protein
MAMDIVFQRKKNRAQIEQNEVKFLCFEWLVRDPGYFFYLLGSVKAKATFVKCGKSFKA